jgi:hypothetical protein
MACRNCWHDKEFNVKRPNEVVLGHDRAADVAAYTCGKFTPMNKYVCGCSPNKHGRHHKHCKMNLSAPLREDFDFAHPELTDFSPINSFNVVYTPAGNIVKLK